MRDIILKNKFAKAKLARVSGLTLEIENEIIIQSNSNRPCLIPQWIAANTIHRQNEREGERAGGERQRLCVLYRLRIHVCVAVCVACANKV